MAYAKPIVATRVGGIPELVEDGASGYLVDRGDDSAMSEKILELVSNRSLRETMGRRGQEIANEKFNLSKSVSKLIDCYGI